MSGHSKWSQIKHKKSLTDQKRGQLFSKLSKNITLAARKGTDPKTNTALANAIEQAQNMNMPNNNIERAINKVSEKDSAQLEEFLVEAIWTGARLRQPSAKSYETAQQSYGRTPPKPPATERGQGVALRIRGVTDNKNRTISEVKRILSDHGAKMVQPGSISWMFGAPVQANKQTQQKINELLENLNSHEDIEDVESNL